MSHDNGGIKIVETQKRGTNRVNICSEYFARYKLMTTFVWASLFMPAPAAEIKHDAVAIQQQPPIHPLNRETRSKILSKNAKDIS